jgi:hypothetical protein
MNGKPWYQSRTFWFAVAKFALGVITAFSAAFGSMIPASIAGALLMASSVIDMWLRANTTTVLTS